MLFFFQKMECAFKCSRPLKRKRALLECNHCNETVLCCVDCVQSHEVCLPCEPAVRTKEQTKEILKIVAKAAESGCAFSDTDHSETKLWSDLACNVTTKEITVLLNMGGSHSVDDDYHVDEACISHLREITIQSRSPKIKGLEKQLQQWAEHFEFDKDDLMDYLKYEPGSIACGTWTGEYTVYAYLIDKEEQIRKEVDEHGFTFSLTKFPITNSAALSVHYDDEQEAYFAVPQSEVPDNVWAASVLKARAFDLTDSDFTLYAYWKST